MRLRTGLILSLTLKHHLVGLLEMQVLIAGREQEARPMGGCTGSMEPLEHGVGHWRGTRSAATEIPTRAKAGTRE